MGAVFQQQQVGRELNPTSAGTSNDLALAEHNDTAMVTAKNISR